MPNFLAEVPQLERVPRRHLRPIMPLFHCRAVLLSARLAFARVQRVLSCRSCAAKPARPGGRDQDRGERMEECSRDWFCPTSETW